MKEFPASRGTISPALAGPASLRSAVDGKFQKTSLAISDASKTTFETDTNDIPPQVRFAADEKPNIKVTNLSIISNSHDLFKIGQTLEIACDLTMESVKTAYAVTIKTDTEEIVRKRIEKPYGSFMKVIGNYVLKKTGLRPVPVACRADYENNIEESDERDNRLLKYLAVWPEK